MTAKIKGREFGSVSNEILCGPWAIYGDEYIPARPMVRPRYCLRRLSDGAALAWGPTVESLQKTARALDVEHEIVPGTPPPVRRTPGGPQWFQRRDERVA